MQSCTHSCATGAVISTDSQWWWERLSANGGCMNGDLWPPHQCHSIEEVISVTKTVLLSLMIESQWDQAISCPCNAHLSQPTVVLSEKRGQFSFGRNELLWIKIESNLKWVYCKFCVLLTRIHCPQMSKPYCSKGHSLAEGDFTTDILYLTCWLSEMLWFVSLGQSVATGVCA